MINLEKVSSNLIKDRKFRWLIFSLLIVAIFEILSLSGWSLPTVIAFPVFLIVTIAIGYKTIVNGLKALSQLNFKSISLLIVIAMFGAFYIGKYIEATIVIVLFNLAEKLEEHGIETSKAALRSLAERMPKTAFVKRLGHVIAVEEVNIDDEIIVKPGEMIPLDGIITTGFTAVDEAAITGEPIPKDKMKDDLVFAGTLNKQGYIEVRVTKQAKNTTLAKIQEITSQAFQQKAQTHKFIETFSSYYTPSIIVLAFFWAIIPPYFFSVPFRHSLQEALSLLVIACPCALVISTPVSIYSAIGNAASKGILIKGGRYLEALGKIKAIALDKTRTLTFGNPAVTDVIPFGQQTRENILSCAAGIESQSEHPLAQSIVQAAQEENLALHPIENFQIKVGKGAQADCLVCEDKHHCIGKLELILEEHQVPNEVLEKINFLQKEGKTVIVICTRKEVEGVIGLQDKIRPECVQMVDDIKKLGITPVMLTGDHATSAFAVAQKIGIENVKSNLLPEDKAKAIQELLSKYGAVAMVGDGINDAPALALSNVGITMSELGSDTAIGAASIVILNEHLKYLSFLVRLGRKVVKTIRVNTVLAISIKVIFITLALIGMSNLALAIFADVGVTLIVILNSLRLTKIN